MESQPQNPEFRNNPENFHQRILRQLIGLLLFYFCDYENIFDSV